MMIFAWRHKRAIGDVFDFTVPLPGLGLFAGRIGNFINGELWGKPTTVPWGFNVNGEVRHASQLYEAFFEGLVLFAMHLVVHVEAAAAAGALGPVPRGLWRGAVLHRVRARAGRAHRLSRGRLAHHGAGAVAADDLRWASSCSSSPTAGRAVGQSRRP